MAKLITALSVGVGGLLLGWIGASFVRRALTKDTRKAEIQEVAPAAASFIFWMFTAAGLIGAVSVTSPETLKPIPTQLVTFLPNALVAGLFVIVGKVASVLLATAVGQTMQRASGRRQPAIERLIRSSVMGIAALLALGQLKINTTILNLMTAGLIFSIALSFALLAGFGGRDVARHIAAGRTLRSTLQPGNRITSGELHGVILDLHPATVELALDDGQIAQVPYAQLLELPLRVTPAEGRPESPPQR